MTPTRRFELHRDIDETGMSGTGVVAAGVLFPLTADEVAAGRDPEKAPVALRWLTAWPTSVVFHERGMESVEAIHGHDGKTRIVWLDDDRGLTCHDYDGAMADLHALVQVANESLGDATDGPARLRRFLDRNHPKRARP